MELSDWATRSGVYFITTDEVTSDEELWVKVGLGKSLEHRLDSYLLYYPRGFNVLCILHTHAKNASKVEQVIHDVLRRKMRQMKTTHSHSGEWFKLSKVDITTLFTSLCSLTPNYILKKYSQNLVDHPWHVCSNWRRINQKVELVLDPFAQRLYDKIHGITTIQKPRKLKRRSYDGGVVDKALDFEAYVVKKEKILL